MSYPSEETQKNVSDNPGSANEKLTTLNTRPMAMMEKFVQFV